MYMLSKMHLGRFDCDNVFDMALGKHMHCKTLYTYSRCVVGYLQVTTIITQEMHQVKWTLFLLVGSEESIQMRRSVMACQCNRVRTR